MKLIRLTMLALFASAMFLISQAATKTDTTSKHSPVTKDTSQEAFTLKSMGKIIAIQGTSAIIVKTKKTVDTLNISSSTEIVNINQKAIPFSELKSNVRVFADYTIISGQKVTSKILAIFPAPESTPTTK